MAAGQPAGTFSKVYGLVEFKNGVRRVEPSDIAFRDEDYELLCRIDQDEDGKQRIIKGEQPDIRKESKKEGTPGRAKIIAVDFDGTLVEEGKWPEIGATNHKVLNYCKREQEKGARIILWTNRAGESLDNAIKWCEEHGLRLDAVNDNLQESVDFFGFNTRKIYADEFIDDRMKEGFNLPYTEG